MYTEIYRKQVQDYILEIARVDKRIVDGAIVGSESVALNDEWSDIDLTFGVADQASIDDILADWTKLIQEKCSAAHLFDLPYQSSIYRVFLLPNCLQVDISFTPTADFGAMTPKFKLLFGHAKEKAQKKPPSPRKVFGYAVHHALRARFSIERGRLWQAEYWLSACRDYALTLACLGHGLNPHDGRGYDDLPSEVHNYFKESFSYRLHEKELRATLKIIVSGLLKISGNMPQLDIDVTKQLKFIGGIKD